jgi:hypothetical protein
VIIVEVKCSLCLLWQRLNDRLELVLCGLSYPILLSSLLLIGETLVNLRLINRVDSRPFIPPSTVEQRPFGKQLIHLRIPTNEFAERVDNLRNELVGDSGARVSLRCPEAEPDANLVLGCVAR